MHENIYFWCRFEFCRKCGDIMLEFRYVHNSWNCSFLCICSQTSFSQELAIICKNKLSKKSWVIMTEYRSTTFTLFKKVLSPNRLSNLETPQDSLHLVILWSEYYALDSSLHTFGKNHLKEREKRRRSQSSQGEQSFQFPFLLSLLLSWPRNRFLQHFLMLWNTFVFSNNSIWTKWNKISK